jgi:hypothetical protein
MIAAILYRGSDYFGSSSNATVGLAILVLVLLGYGFRKLVIHTYGPKYTKRQFRELAFGICFLGGTIYTVVAIALAILK